MYYLTAVYLIYCSAFERVLLRFFLTASYENDNFPYILWIGEEV